MAPTDGGKRLRMLETLLAFLLLVSLGPAAYAQEAVPDTGCSVRGFFHETWSETSQFGHGLKAVPREAVRPSPYSKPQGSGQTWASGLNLDQLPSVMA